MLCWCGCGAEIPAEDSRGRIRLFVPGHQAKKQAQPDPVGVVCTMCGRPVQVLTRHQRAQVKRAGRLYCSVACGRAYTGKISSATMARTNLKYASARMTARNPMHRAETRAKVSETLRAIGHKPRIRGGNGRGMTKPQLALYEALGADWIVEFVIPTHMSRVNTYGYPGHFKIDLALPGAKLAVEVDGGSHATIARQQQDSRKEAFLSSIGWTVLRFRNRDVLSGLNTCLDAIRSTISRLVQEKPIS